MASNTDNAMTRFLFAILRQKDLRDIDWNKVANDPILVQEISNGHAARMRYSRFRSSMLGVECTRRNKSSASKAKPIRSKKSTISSTLFEQTGEDTHVKSVKEETDQASCTAQQPSSIATATIKIKEEDTQNHTQHTFQGVQQEANKSEAPIQHIQPRMLTPCSDVDVFVATSAQHYHTQPVVANDMLHQSTESAFEFGSLPLTAHCSTEQHSWHPSPSYSPYAGSYEIDGFMSTSTPFGEHHQQMQPGGYGMSPAMIAAQGHHSGPLVKNEMWDTSY